MRPQELFSIFDKVTETKLYFHKTQDGSYSCCFDENDPKSELMHSHFGAFSETVYLYYPMALA